MTHEIWKTGTKVRFKGQPSHRQDFMPKGITCTEAVICGRVALGLYYIRWLHPGTGTPLNSVDLAYYHQMEKIEEPKEASTAVVNEVWLKDAVASYPDLKSFVAFATKVEEGYVTEIGRLSMALFVADSTIGEKTYLLGQAIDMIDAEKRDVMKANDAAKRLSKFARHKDGCPAEEAHEPKEPCTCGFSWAREVYEAANKKVA